MFHKILEIVSCKEANVYNCLRVFSSCIRVIKDFSLIRATALLQFGMILSWVKAFQMHKQCALHFDTDVKSFQTLGSKWVFIGNLRCFYLFWLKSMSAAEIFYALNECASPWATWTILTSTNRLMENLILFWNVCQNFDDACSTVLYLQSGARWARMLKYQAKDKHQFLFPGCLYPKLY